jgi:hypothetical protein
MHELLAFVIHRRLAAVYKRLLIIFVLFQIITGLETHPDVQSLVSLDHSVAFDESGLSQGRCCVELNVV